MVGRNDLLLRRVCVLALAAVLLVACGGGGDVDTSGDPQKAADAVLRQSDLPDGFAPKDSSSSSSGDTAGDQAAKECYRKATGKDPDVLENERTGKAEAKFEQGAGVTSVEVDGEVELYPDGTALSEQLQAFALPATADCLTEAFNTEFTLQGLPVSELDLRFNRLDGVGDEAGQFLLSATLLVSGVEIQLGSEINFVRVGRAALTATVTRFNAAPDHELALTALNAMKGRLG